MNSNINLKKIISYLKSQDIKLDVSEFKYQVETHPEYPSLLSFSDALTFFKINNMAFKINSEEIEAMPEDFIALLKDKNGLHLEHVKNGNELVINKAIINKDEFNNKFEQIVLLAEKEDDFDQNSSSKSNSITYLFLIFLFAFSLIAFNSFQFSWLNSFFFSTSFLGLLISLETFKQIIGEKTNVVSKLCNATEKTSCDSVLTSKKWKIFKYINLSDISILFFINQFTLLLIFGINQNLDFIYSILFLGIGLIIPISLISIYYQWKIEKRWCPLCLIIIGILWLQSYLIYSSLIFIVSYTSIYNLILLLSTIVFLTFTWYIIKNHLLTWKDTQDKLKVNLRFKKNYKIFKEQILKEERYSPPINDNSILIGNKDAKTRITVFTSPFCGHCQEVHNILNALIEKYTDQIAVHINFSTIRDENNLKNYLIIKKLQTIFLNEGYQKFHSNLNNIFNKENVDSFNNNFEDKKNEVDLIIKDQANYFYSNGVTFTPLILINGYNLPAIYEKKDIEYFFTDLIEDEKW